MTLLPTYDGIVVPNCHVSDQLGQVANWVQHASNATDKWNFVDDTGASMRGYRDVKVHGPGSVQDWWFLISFICPQPADWNNGQGDSWGNSIYNWHNYGGDVGWTGSGDDPTSCLHIFFRSFNKVETTLAATYSGGGTMQLTSTAGFRNTQGNMLANIGSASRVNAFQYSAISGNNLTGISGSFSQSWPAGTRVWSSIDGLLLLIEQDGSAQWVLPDPVPGQRYDIVLHIIFGNVSQPQYGLTTSSLECWVNGSDTKVIDRSGCDILQYDATFYLAPGGPRMQRYFTFWEGGPYVLGEPTRHIGNITWKHRFCATRMGNTLAEALADVPVNSADATPPHQSFWTNTGVTPAGTRYGRTDFWIGAPYQNFGDCRHNMDFVGGAHVAYDVPKMNTVDFLLPPSLGGSGGGPPPTIPVSSVVPTVTGTPSPGNTLTTSNGTWQNSPTSFTYQWELSFNPLYWETIAGATAATLAVTSALAGTVVRCRVTASNSAGQASAVSAQTALISVSGSWFRNGLFETDAAGWGQNQGTETLTRDTAIKHGGAASLKIVTPGTSTFEGSYANVGLGMACPAGIARTLSLWVNAPVAASIRVGLHTIGQDTALILSTIATVTGNGAFQQVVLSIPPPAADAYQQLSVTTGSTPQAITFYLDDVSLTDVAATAAPPVVDGTQLMKGTDLTISGTITIGNNNNRAVYICIDHGDQGRPVTSVTVGGVAATLVRKSSDYGCEVWRLLAPPTGAQPVVITNTNVVAYVVGVVSLYNVDQAAPEAASAQAISSGTHPTVTVAGSPTALVLATCAIGSNGAETAADDAGQTSLWNSRQYTSFGTKGVGVTKPGDVSVTVGWTLTGTGGLNAGAVAVAVSGVAVAAAPGNTAVPVISDTTPTEDQILSVTDGTWSGSPTLFSPQWQRDTAGNGVPIDIGGATFHQYGVTFNDAGNRLRCAVTAVNATGSTIAYSAWTSVTTGLAPTNTTAPAITGVQQVGSTLGCDTGSWGHSPPSSYAYQWQRDTAGNGTFANVAGATSATYTQTSPDGGNRLRCVVTATNAYGASTPTPSAPTSIVIVPPSAPVNTDLPQITVSGGYRQGRTAQTDSGLWSNIPTSFTYQWQRCDAAGASCANIGGATSPNYLLAAADVGSTIRVVVTAANAAGTTSATSAATPVIGPPTVQGGGARVVGGAVTVPGAKSSYGGTGRTVGGGGRTVGG